MGARPWVCVCVTWQGQGHPMGNGFQNKAVSAGMHLHAGCTHTHVHTPHVPDGTHQGSGFDGPLMPLALLA